MQVTLDISDEFAQQNFAGKDAARAALEAIAVDGCRTGQLNESQVRRMLGLEVRIQVHTLLAEHHVCLQYSPEHLALDIQAFEEHLAERAAQTVHAA